MIKKIIERYNVYHFKDNDFFDINSFLNYNDGFVLKLSLDSKISCSDTSVLLKTPGFELRYCKKNINNKEEFTQSEISDRVWLHEKNGYVELLEMKMDFICPYTNAAFDLSPFKSITPDSTISRYKSFPSRERSPTPVNTEKPPCIFAILLINSII